MYSFVDQNSAFFVHVVGVAHVFYREIYTLRSNFEFPSFGFGRGFRVNYYKAISLSRLKWFSTEQHETINLT